MVDFTPDPFTPAHCRAARLLLGWSATQLAQNAELGEATIRNFERGFRPNLQKRTRRDILRAFRDAGIRWREEQPGDPLVKCTDGVVAELDRTVAKSPNV